MLKEKDRVVWRFKDGKKYTEGYIKEIDGKMLSIADSNYGLRQWVDIEEIDLKILKKTD